MNIPCPEHEDHLLARAGGEPAAGPEAVALDRHLTTCPGCRAFLAEQAELDSALSAAVGQPHLSTGFKQQMLQRVARAGHALAGAEIEARKRQLQAEYEAQREGLRQAVARGARSNCLRMIQFAVAVGVVALVVPSLIDRLPIQAALTKVASGMTPADLMNGLLALAAVAGGYYLYRQPRLTTRMASGE